jgi:hypothetical protein
MTGRDRLQLVSAQAGLLLVLIPTYSMMLLIQFQQGQDASLVLLIQDLSNELDHPYTDKKENKIFLISKEIHNRAVAKSYMTNGLLIYGEIFPHILGSPSSYMALQLLHSEFPHI